MLACFALPRHRLFVAGIAAAALLPGAVHSAAASACAGAACAAHDNLQELQPRRACSLTVLRYQQPTDVTVSGPAQPAAAAVGACATAAGAALAAACSVQLPALYAKARGSRSSFPAQTLDNKVGQIISQELDR